MKRDSVTYELQIKERAMLAQLTEILNRNKIEFFLACGTALGCVRHNGFIPWDNDVDIYIRGKDYKRLRIVFENQDTGSLRLQDYETVADYPYTFPKIVDIDTVLVEDELKHLQYSGVVYIDVFLLAECSNNSIQRYFTERIRYFRYCALKAYFFELPGKLKILSRFAKFLNCKKIENRLFSSYQKEFKNCYKLVDVGTFGKQALLSKEDFENRISMRFESIDVPMPQGYNHYLKGYYGDYWILPPEEERVARHNFVKLVIDGKQLI